MTYNDYYLQHHGIIGQKWGIRRFQNKDGSLTLEGKKRYSTEKDTDHNISINTKKDRRNEVVGMYALSAMTLAANAATIGIGFISPQLLAASAASTIAAFATHGMYIADSIAAKKATKKEEEFKKERENEPIDKKTGFHKKTTKMTPDEDMERVNPAYKNWDENTKSNCVLCTATLELRRRGYDVQAKRASRGYNGNEIIKDWFKGAKPKESEGSLTNNQLISNALTGQRQSKADKIKMIDSTFDNILKQKNGARGQICFTFDGSTSGHSIAYANENGKVVIYDSQVNKKYVDDKARNYLESAAKITVTRLDNCEINTKYIKEVAE